MMVKIARRAADGVRIVVIPWIIPIIINGGVRVVIRAVSAGQEVIDDCITDLRLTQTLDVLHGQVVGVIRGTEVVEDWRIADIFLSELFEIGHGELPAVEHALVKVGRNPLLLHFQKGGFALFDG